MDFKNWLNDVTGTDPDWRTEYDPFVDLEFDDATFLSLSQTMGMPESSNATYGYIGSFALGAAAASAYLFYVNKRDTAKNICDNE